MIFCLFLKIQDGTWEPVSVGNQFPAGQLPDNWVIHFYVFSQSTQHYFWMTGWLVTSGHHLYSIKQFKQFLRVLLCLMHVSLWYQILYCIYIYNFRYYIIHILYRYMHNNMLLLTHPCSSSSTLLLLPTSITFFKFKDGSSGYKLVQIHRHRPEGRFTIYSHQVTGW